MLEAGEEATSEAGVAVVASDATADSLVAFVACPVGGRAPRGAERSGAIAPPFADDNDRSGEAPDPRAAGRYPVRFPAVCGGGDSRTAPGFPVELTTAGLRVAATATAAAAAGDIAAGDNDDAAEFPTADRRDDVVATEPAPLPVTVCALVGPSAGRSDARGTGGFFVACGANTIPSPPPLAVGAPALLDPSTGGL